MRVLLLSLFLLTIVTPPAMAGIGVILPYDDLVGPGEKTEVTLQLRIFEPRERHFVEMARPKGFSVAIFGEETSLLPGLKAAAEQKTVAWLAEATLKRPGDYLFHAEAAPIWDPTEEEFVVHHAKLCVNAAGLEEGWDEPAGIDAEIVPMTRPYGLWTGNLFSGQVLLNGEPAPYATVEVVTLGTSADSPALTALPAGAYRVQAVRADATGVFHYAMPRAGWWGFAATVDADWTIKRDGSERPVSLVTSYWVLTRDMP